MMHRQHDLLLLALTVAEEEENSQTSPTPYVLGQTVATAAPATRAVRHTHARANERGPW